MKNILDKHKSIITKLIDEYVSIYPILRLEAAKYLDKDQL